MSNNLGNINVVLTLDVKQYAESWKSAMRIAEISNKEIKNFLNFKSPTIDVSKVDSEIKKLESSLVKYQTTTKSAATETKQFDKELSSVNKSAETSGKSFLASASQLTIFAGGMAAVIMTVKQFLTESFELGVQLNTLRKSFTGLASQDGLNAVGLINKLKEATANTIPEVKLLQIVSRGKFLNVDLELMPDLLKFATIRAKEMGESVDYMADSIITGLGRKSPLILDNLGLTMRELDKAVIDVAKSKGHLIKKVDEETRAMYLNEAAVIVARQQIEKSSISLNDNAFYVDKVTTKLEDFKAKFGAAFSESLLKSANEFDKTLRNMGGSADETQKKMDLLADVLGRYVAMLLKGTPWTAYLIDNFSEIIRQTKILDSILGKDVSDNFFKTIAAWISYLKQDIVKFLQLINLLPTGPGKRASKEGEAKETFSTSNEDISDLQRASIIGNENNIPKVNSKGSSTNKDEKEKDKKALEKLKEELLKIENRISSQTLGENVYESLFEKLDEIKNAIYFIENYNTLIKIPDININDVVRKELKRKPLDPIEIPFELQLKLDKKRSERTKKEILNSDEYKEAKLLIGSIADTLRDNLGKAWRDVFGEANSLFEQFMQKLITSLAELTINWGINALLSELFPGLGIISNFFGGALPGLASGGNTSANKAYIVGENGMELFIPNQNGYVFNSADTQRILSFNPTQYQGGNQKVSLEVAETKIKGNDIYLSWRRTKRVEDGRIR